jgi:hypothetical protein
MALMRQWAECGHPIVLNKLPKRPVWVLFAWLTRKLGVHLEFFQRISPSFSAYEPKKNPKSKKNQTLDGAFLI